jgi:integrase
MIEACGGGWTGARNRALIALYYRAGLRCAEALSLQVEDVQGGSVWVRRPKGVERRQGRRSDPREVGLDVKTRRMMDAYIEVRGPGAGLLFQTRRGKPVLPSYVRQLIPRLGTRAGIPQRVHAHALRHTFARELYLETRDPLAVMLSLGHRSLKTTTEYLTSIGATDVVPITAGREW